MIMDSVLICLDDKLLYIYKDKTTMKKSWLKWEKNQILFEPCEVISLKFMSFFEDSKTSDDLFWNEIIAEQGNTSRKLFDENIDLLSNGMHGSFFRYSTRAACDVVGPPIRGIYSIFNTWQRA